MQNINEINKTKRYVLIITTIALLGELYIYPLDGNFRFSTGVIAFSLVLLLIDINEISLALLTATATLLLRTIIFTISLNTNLIDGIISNLPGSLYYVLYGLMAYFFGLRKNKKNFYQIFISLFAIDVLCNLGEALIRNNLDSSFFKLIILVVLVRSILIYGLYIFIVRQEHFIQQNEFKKRYLQLNTLISSIQAEMFYLKKSTVDIEKVMSKSYELYESNKENKDISKDALIIARDIHEIKKDYYRVLKGFESFLTDFETNDSMSLKDILYIIESNCKRYIEQKNKNIKLYITIDDNIDIKNYYTIFTVLNNLIVNAIDAIEYNGYIEIKETINHDNLVFNVSNNGESIEIDLIPFIFNPGFTTKFDETTGNASTGIGLAHVKNIIDELDGIIEVDSNVTETKFIISIPLKSLRGWKIC